MIKTKVAFLEGRLFSSQSEQPEKFSKSLIVRLTLKYVLFAGKLLLITTNVQTFARNDFCMVLCLIELQKNFLSQIDLVLFRKWHLR